VELLVQKTGWHEVHV